MAKNANDKRKKQKKATRCSEAVQDHAAAGAAAELDTHEPFESWLDDAGVVWRECCRLGQAASGGQGVFAVRDIAAGEPVLAVPDDAVLMPDDSCIAKVSVSRHAGLCTALCSAQSRRMHGVSLPTRRARDTGPVRPPALQSCTTKQPADGYGKRYSLLRRAGAAGGAAGQWRPRRRSRGGPRPGAGADGRILCWRGVQVTSSVQVVLAFAAFD